jgi:hypothetical protein
MMRRAALACALVCCPVVAQAQTSEPPRATLLYQNFPNPFPSGGILATCFWFDLARDSDVHIQVLDIRGNVVRTLVPSPTTPGHLTAGRYGRGTGDVPDGFGCDERYIWDGTASDGSLVPAGVYLLRMRADGADIVRRILFLGR